MIVWLAVRTHTVPDQWNDHDPQDVITALDILDKMDKEAAKRNGN